MRDYNFGEFIYKLRVERGLSQTKFGELVGVSNKAVSKWENGVSKPSTDTLKKISEVFGVSVEELLSGKRSAEEFSDDLAQTTDIPNPDIVSVSPEVISNVAEAALAAPAVPSAPPSRKKKMIKLAAIISAVLLLAVLVTVSACHFGEFIAGGDETTQNTENTEPESAPDLETVKKSVVKIETNIGLGSGFCALKDDWIITNYHVIENSNKIYVIDDDGDKTEILKIVFYDEDKDIAVLQSAKSFAPIELGDGSALALQDGITVIGSPQGVLNTVSVGIISNVSYEDYIVISAPISPGSSGGVLLNDKYQAIGIITATAKDEMAQNLNFAINIEYLKESVTAYDAGEYKEPDYPLNPNGRPSDGGGTDETFPEEVPSVMSQCKPEYVRDEKLFRIVLSMISNHGHNLAADVQLGLVITNLAGEVVYDGKLSVKKSDFSEDSYGTKTATVDLPIADIKKGSTGTGKIAVKLIYKGDEVDSREWDIERGLPVKTESFETLIYSSNGVGSIAGIDLPYGTYNIIFTHDGQSGFEAELNGRSIYRSIIWGKTEYVYQLKPDEDMYYEGTPLTNAVLNIVTASGPWTVTIERADTSEEGRTYVDGLTYSGSGVGYVKDIYLPYGIYNITITHSGSSVFDIQLDGRSILRKFGQLSYVYTLKPEEDMYYSGTPMPSAYFNITEADGDWTITINRVS